MVEALLDISTGLAIASVAYAATNIDNLLVLATMAMAHPDRGALARGHLLASLVTLLICLSFVSISFFVPSTALSYLGIVPIIFGIRILFTAGDPASQTARMAPSTKAVATMLVANSADSVATFGPLFAESEPLVVAALAVGFAATALLWLRMVFVLSRRWQRAGRGGGLSPRLPGLIMIAVGAYVLADTGTDLE